MGIAGRFGLWKRSGATGGVALGFTSEIVSLYAQERHGEWSEVGTAEISAPGFAEQIEALRVEALVRDKSRSPITIWLPGDQVIERHYTLAATSEDARQAEAARRIADETPHSVQELSVAIASDSRFEPVKVLAVLIQTMVEARSYAADWGFVPGAISTQVGTHAFPPPGPVFEFPRSAASKAGRTIKQLAAAASVLALMGGAGYGAYQMLGPLLEAPADISSSGPAPASYAVFMDPPPGRQAPLGAVEKTAAGNLGLTKMSADADALARAAGTSGYRNVPVAKPPRGLKTPNGTDPLKVGAAPDRPRWSVTVGDTEAPNLSSAPILAAIDPVAPAPITGGDAGPPVATDTAVAPPDDADDTTAPVSDLTTAANEPEETDDPESGQVSTSEFAPEKMATLPPRRPGTEPRTETAEASAETEKTPAETTEAPTESAEAPAETAETTTEEPAEETAAIDPNIILPTPRPAALLKTPEPPESRESPAEEVETETKTAIVTPDPRPKDFAATAGIASDTLRKADTVVPAAKPVGELAKAPAADRIPSPTLALPPARPESIARRAATTSVPTPTAEKPRTEPAATTTAAAPAATAPAVAAPTAPTAKPRDATSAPRLAAAPANLDLKTDTPTVDDTSTRAAIKAPEPSKRPSTLEFAARRMPARTRTPLSVYLPRSVGDAARRTGLSLDKTNLIGVIEAKNGRQALVRLPDGGFRKVGKGDNIDGWRVGAVNRESVRLSRRGENRTLLLVAP